MKRSEKALISTITVLTFLVTPAVAKLPTIAELTVTKGWITKNLNTDSINLPFSFMYSDSSSRQFLAAWHKESTTKRLDEGRIAHTLVFTDPETSLQVTCKAIEYTHFPTVEWTLYFKNAGQADTPIISSIKTINTSFTIPDSGEFILHHNIGSHAKFDDYRPLTTLLSPNFKRGMAPNGGRGSDARWPYFNIEWIDAGAIVAVGWPGQWAAVFERDNRNSLQITAGQETTHFKLLPGEEIRSPLIVLQFYKGKWLHGQNIWRQWMLRHNLPRLEGKLPPIMFTASSAGQFHEMQEANEQNQIQFIDGYLDNGIKLDFWWMDAGWYVNGTDWTKVGTWEVDPVRFPNGLRAISDHAHSRGANILVWFEPERVTPGTWLYENHPEWLLGKDGEQKLLYLGNDEARNWLIEHVCRMLIEQGIDIYRQDFNFPPLAYWRSNDAHDRRGISEIRHITGYLAFWDELRRRNPGLLIDTCASGGRRNDLETLRRSVPLHKSDFDYGSVRAKQTQLHGLALWVPYFGAAASTDPYGFRSGIAAVTGIGCDMRTPSNYDFPLIHRLIAERDVVAPYTYLGDYYPLTDWNFDKDKWIAWQFDRSELGSGIVQAFRRPDCEHPSIRVKLFELKAESQYELINFDKPGKMIATGQELMKNGLEITADAPRTAIIVKYSELR